MKKISSNFQEVAFRTINDLRRSDMQEFEMYLDGNFTYCRIDDPKEWEESGYYLWVLKKETIEGELLKIIIGRDIYPPKT